MPHFLLKTEPSVYSFDDLERDKKTTWDGIASNAALKHLRTMKNNDTVFIYHSGEEKQIVGIARVVSEPYPDPQLKDPKMAVIDLVPVKKLKSPVSLKTIKSLKTFSKFPLVTISRLSVMSVSAGEWEDILHLSTKDL